MLDQNTTAIADLSEDPLDRRHEPRPTSGEAPFELHEVFFSRTDARGVIEAGNYVFRRVAHYDWSELIGAPHKLIRHPDMPRGVFWLLWHTLKQGIPIGAYVKNQAKDGLHYWVFASVVPCAGGYLSARIKPVSPLRDVVEAEYAALLQREQDEGLTPEESGQTLLGRLSELGFEDYQRFEAHALSEELIARQRGLDQPDDPHIQQHRDMLDAALQLQKATDTLVREFNGVKIIPHNMRAIASRLEPTGGPFRTLSGDYGKMSTDISNWFEQNVVGENSNFSAIRTSVVRSMFLDGLTKILDECEHQLNWERRRSNDNDIERERAYLKSLVETYRTQSNDSRMTVRKEAERILAACAQMTRHIMSLRTTRVLCKIESARMGPAGVGLKDIIAQLGRFQDEINDHLGAVQGQSERIRFLASEQDSGGKGASKGLGRMKMDAPR